MEIEEKDHLQGVLAMKKWRKQEDGLLSLEASISLTIFIFLMLFLYSFFIIFEARNEMAHVLLASTKSLSLDTYAVEKLKNEDNLAEVFFEKLYGTLISYWDDYTSTQEWASKGESDGKVYADPGKSESEEKPILGDVIRKRFLAYLAGGSEEEAEKILKHYHIKGGLAGLDFSESYVDSGNLYVVVRYELEYEFQVFGLGSVSMRQSVCSRLWK